MGDRLLQVFEFFIERPPLSGALLCGALYLLKRTRKPHMSSSERQHAMEISDAQRTYAEKMYDPPTDEEQAVTRRSRK
jgi:tryptophanyl-tRNA synthetase